MTGINNRQLVIYNVEGLKTFYTIIRNAEKKGKIEARSGCHDDYAMAVGIAWRNRGKVMENTIRIKSYSYRE